MGTQTHGLYARLYADVWTNRKTFALAEALQRLGVPERFAIREAVGQLHELLCWCLAASDEGDVGHLPARVFARVVGWQEGNDEALVAAWIASGFLEHVEHSDGSKRLRVHDFAECAADLLAKRRARRELRQAARAAADPFAEINHPAAGPQKPHDVDRGATAVHRKCTGGAPAGPRELPLARARSATATAVPPPTPSGAPSEDDAVVVGLGNDPEPGTRDADPGQPADLAGLDLSGADQTALLACWNDARATRRLGPSRPSRKLLEGLKTVWKAFGCDLDDLRLVLARYFAARDDFAQARGWPVAGLVARLDGLAAEVARFKAARQLERDRDAAGRRVQAEKATPEQRRAVLAAKAAESPIARALLNGGPVHTIGASP